VSEGEVCRVNWRADNQTHICRRVGEHEKHTCNRCGAMKAKEPVEQAAK